MYRGTIQQDVEHSTIYFEGTTEIKLRIHEINTYIALAGELCMFSMRCVEKSDCEITGTHFTAQK